jgi:hypothetical protein
MPNPKGTVHSHVIYRYRPKGSALAVARVAWDMYCEMTESRSPIISMQLRNGHWMFIHVDGSGGLVSQEQVRKVRDERAQAKMAANALQARRGAAAGDADHGRGRHRGIPRRLRSGGEAAI